MRKIGINPVGIEKICGSRAQHGRLCGTCICGVISRKFAWLLLFNSHAADDPEEKKIDRNKAIKVVKRKPMILINEMIPNLFADKNIKPYTKEVLFITRIASQLTKRGIINCLEGMKARPDRQHILQKTKVPVLYIMGKKDPVMNFDTLSPQLMLSPKIIACVLDNAGHMGYIEAKEECLIALKKWLRECFFEG
jgi:pimeloyl-ACP methyl ester carboxylesterase